MARNGFSIGMILFVSAFVPACSGSGQGGPPGSPPQMSGDYYRVGFSANEPLSQDLGIAGPITYSSTGLFSQTTTVNVNGTISAGSSSGTFTGVPGGALSWTNGLGEGFSGGIRTAGDLVISGAATLGSSPGIFVDLKTGGGTFNNSTLAGTYFNVSFAFQPGVSSYHYTITGLLTFDGAGNWTTTMSGNNEGTIFSGATNTGTYSVAADGKVSLSDPGTVFLGSVLSSGDLLLLGTFGAGARVEIILCARKGGSFTAASMQGAYRVIAFGSLPPGHHHFSSTGKCTFDGAGGITWTGTQNTEGVLGSLNGMPETYTIAADGTLTIVNSGVGSGLTLTGGAVAGGTLAVVSAVTAGNRLETRILMKE